MHITFIIRKPEANIWERKNFKQKNTWTEYQTLKILGAYYKCIIKHSSVHNLEDQDTVRFTCN